MKKTNWMKLDNAAKIFPPTSSKNDPRVFRVTCVLKEKVDVKVLQKALKKTMPFFPHFSYILKRGLFWYYLEQTDLNPTLEVENLPVCAPIYDKNVKKLLFRVFYYENRIHFEVYHVLTDGTGASVFMKTLLFFYLKTKYPKEFKNQEFPFSYFSEQEKDSFDTYYEKRKISLFQKNEKAYQLHGKKYSFYRLKVYEGTVSTSEILKKAKEYNTTITGLVSALFLISIFKTIPRRYKNKRVVLTVPVNFRKVFPSYTTRNFFGTVNVGYNFKKDYDLKDVIDCVTNDLKTNIEKENLEQIMNGYAALEHIFLLRAIPLFIKNPVLKFANFVTSSSSTASLSNVGKVDLPKEYQKYVSYFSVTSSTCGMQLCLCSYEDVFTFSLSSRFINKEVCKNFFCLLKDMGLNIELGCNNLEEEEDVL